VLPVILINQGPSVKEECHGCGEENVVSVFVSMTGDICLEYTMGLH